MDTPSLLFRKCNYSPWFFCAFYKYTVMHYSRAWEKMRNVTKNVPTCAFCFYMTEKVEFFSDSYYRWFAIAFWKVFPLCVFDVIIYFCGNKQLVYHTNNKKNVPTIFPLQIVLSKVSWRRLFTKKNYSEPRLVTRK